MPSTERIITVAAVMFALGLGVGQLGRVLPSAQAQDGMSPSPEAAAQSESASEEAAETPDVQIVAPERSQIAVCAVPTLVNELMESDRFLPEREALQEELRAEFDDMVARATELRNQLQNADPNDPASQQLMTEFQALQQELQAKQTELSTQLDAFVTEQLQEAYELVLSSAKAIADEHGFNYVMSSIGDQEEPVTNPNMLLSQIQARPIVHAPEGTDITAEVRDDLKLD